MGARVVVTGHQGPAISLRDVTVAYQRHPAVHHVSGTFAAGSLTAIVGPNGAGKSSLVKAIVGLLRLDEGHIDLHGLHRRDIAYLPQLTAIDEAFPISVLDAVLFGHWRRAGAFRSIDAAMRAGAVVAIEQVGLDGFAARTFGSLSAGQRQRALFARLIVADCPMILLDEPFSAIDARTAAALLDLIHGWHQQGRTILAVLHDLDQVRRHFPQTLLLARDLIAWGPTEVCLTAENLRRSGAMNAAWVAETGLCEGPP